MAYYYDNLIVLCVTLTMSLKCCVKHKGDISPAHKNLLSVGYSESGRQRLFPFTFPLLLGAWVVALAFYNKVLWMWVFKGRCGIIRKGIKKVSAGVF